MFIKDLRVPLLFFTLIMSARCDTYDFPDAPYPRIETLEVTNISVNGVTFRARFDPSGGQTIVNHGFVWGLQERFLVSGADRVDLGPASNPDVQATVEHPFYANTTYYVKAFVQTESFVVYGIAMPFPGGRR